LLEDLIPALDTTDGLDIRSDDSANPTHLRVIYPAPSCQ
jgi:hypothetical protein